MDNFTDFIFGDVNDTMDTSSGAAESYSPPDSAIARFGVSYQRVHGYLSVTVCVFGIISNVLSIIVLTRKHMKSPTNFILTALAIADILVMSTYSIVAVYLYIITSPGCMRAKHSRVWINVLLIYSLFFITCHNISMWLTVTLAVFRYIFVCQHTIAARMCSMARAKLAVAVVVVTAIVSCVPLYFVYSVQDTGFGLSRNVSCYSIVASQLVRDNPTYEQFVLWLFGVVIKILPCVLMAFLSTLLIIAMRQAKKRQARLFNTMSRVVDHDYQSSKHNRTTMMLLGVVICFIVTEIPQGILALIWAVDEDFRNDVYSHLGDLMDILVLVNSAVNFILYCIMSQQFRSTFKSLFVCNIPFNLDRINLHRKVAKANGTELSIVMTETTSV